MIHIPDLILNGGITRFLPLECETGQHTTWVCNLLGTVLFTPEPGLFIEQLRIIIVGTLVSHLHAAKE